MYNILELICDTLKKGESDKMNWRRWINKDNETLFDLIFGCIVYSIVFESDRTSCSWRIKEATVWGCYLGQL